MFRRAFLPRLPRPPRFGMRPPPSTAAAACLSGSNGAAPAPPKLSPPTPLLREIQSRILVRGPLSVSEFMTLALQHPQHGYYTGREKVIGAAGDFVTSPEISQLFGELVGVWCVAVWEKLGRPAHVRLVELGGGRGTLMQDVVRTLGSFPRFCAALSGIDMVETSAHMQRLQAEALRLDKGQVRLQPRAPGDGAGRTVFGPTRRVNVRFASKLAEVAADKDPVIIIAQELFDALPVHQFEKTDLGWCERLVDTGPSEHPDLDGLHHHLRFVLSPGPTPAASLLVGALDAPVGTRLELGPMAAALAQEISACVAARGGAALVVDYGSDGHAGAVQESLRGIKAHRFVHPLREPGLVDLSVDVNFADLRRAACSIPKPSANATAVVSQASFLKTLGIEYRVAALLRNPSTSEDQKLALFSGYKRLVEAMGKVYSVLALTSFPAEDAVGFALQTPAAAAAAAAQAPRGPEGA